mmetsp:Transcript_33000/g.51458  ORF Transcript_33000/g.51458 Transcript_33000/m.51458 type:complete len:83 (+) Transcript_33000:476-724(+)
MLSDPEIQVLRVKNRMSQTHDSKASLGYRDCNVSISISNLETRKYGLERHVCEVQLLLRSFYLMRSAEGHLRYVSWRNLRAE